MQCVFVYTLVDTWERNTNSFVQYMNVAHGLSFSSPANNHRKTNLCGALESFIPSLNHKFKVSMFNRVSAGGSIPHNYNF